MLVIQTKHSSFEILDIDPISFVDESEVRDLWWNIELGDIVVDIGAAQGSYSLTALAEGAGYVVAINPENMYYPQLISHVAINKFEPRCAVLSMGCYNQSGYLNEHTLEFSLAEQPGMFPVGPLDELLRDVNVHRVDWIKIDVEGAEYQVLEGACKTIEAFHPKILIENHEGRVPGIHTKCASYLSRYGYSCLGVRPHHSVTHSFFKVTQTEGNDASSQCNL